MFNQITAAIDLKLTLGQLLRGFFAGTGASTATGDDAADAGLPDRLRYDIGYSDRNPDKLHSSRRHGHDVSREMLRRMI